MISWLKDRHRSLILANSIAFISVIEPVLICTLIFSVVWIKKYLLLIPFVLALICHIGGNIAMFVLFRKMTVPDKSFEIWSKRFGFTSKYLPIICLIWNFRLFKLFYSGFFGLDMFMVNFSEPRKSFFKWLNLMSIINFITVYPILILGSMFSISVTYWG